MDKKRSKLMILLMAVSFLVTGCWDSIRITEINLATMVILDKRGEEYTFTVELPKILPGTAEGSGSGAKSAYIKGTGASFPQARDELETHLEMPLYLGAVRTLVITESAAQNDLAEYMFRLREDVTYRQKVILTTTREDPAALVEFEEESDSPRGFAVDNMLAAAVESGRTYDKTTSRYVGDILNDRGFVIHCIGLQDNQLVLTGYSVFRSSKCIGFIPVKEARGLVFLLAKEPAWVYRVPFGGNYATVEVKVAKKKITPAYQEGAVRFSVQFEFEAMVRYVSGVLMFPLDEQAMQEISQNLQQALEEELRLTIERSQKEFQSDYLLFGEEFRIDYPEVYEGMNWNEEYPNAQIGLKTKVDLSVSPKMDYEPK